MGNLLRVVVVALPQGARSVTIEEQETVLTRRAIIAPGLPPGALAVALDDLVLDASPEASDRLLHLVKKQP